MCQFRKLLIALTILSCVLLGGVVSFSEAAAASSKATKNLLIIGALDDYPIMYADQEGAPSGLAVDVLNGYAERMNYSLTYELYPSEQIDAIFRTKGDLKYSSFELDRATDFESTLSFYYKNYALFTSDKNIRTDLSRDALNSYLKLVHKDDLNVGYKTNTSLKKRFFEKYPDTSFTPFDKYSEMIDALKNHTVEYALIPDELGRKFVEEHALEDIVEIRQTLYIEEASFELSKSNVPLLYGFNRYISDIKEDNTLNLLTQKWFEHKIPPKHNTRFLLYFNIFAAAAVIVVLALAYKNIIMQKIIDDKTAEIIEKTQTNERLYQQLLKEEQYKNNYFINLSHDLRTPISLILNAAQMTEATLKSLPETSRQKTSKYANIVSSNSYRLLKMISSLIDLNQLNSGEFKLKIESFDLVMLLEQVMREAIEGGYITPDVIHIESIQPDALIEADIYEISRIFATLMSNSIKYSDGGPDIHIQVRINTDKTEIIYEDYQLKVSSDTLLQLLSSPYYRTDALNKNFEGLSVDLYLIKLLTELHGATMSFDEEAEHTRFIFHFDRVTGCHPVSSDYPKVNYDLKQLVKMTFSDSNHRAKQTKQVCS